MAARGYFNISDSRGTDSNRDSKHVKLIPISAILVVILAITTRIIYGVRVCPVLPVGDAGELATAAYTSGIAHSPGYPLFTMLGRIFSHLPFASPSTAYPDGIFDVAFRMNMMSLWIGVITVLVVYFIIARAMKNPFAAFLGAFLFATGTTFLSQCLIGEVYTLHALITALIIYVLVLINEKPTSWRLLLVALLFGLGLSHHTSVLAMLLPVAVFLFLALSAKKIKLTKGIIWGMLFFFVVGLLPNLYLPSASAKDPFLDWGNPENIGNFFKVATRSEYRGIKESIKFSDESLRMGGLAKAYNGWLNNAYGKWFLIFGYIGLLIALIKGKRFGLMLGLCYLFITVPYFFYFRKISQPELFYLEVYYIPAHLVFAIFIGYMFSWMLEDVPRIIKQTGTRFLFAVLIFAVLLVMALGFYNSHGGRFTMRDHNLGSRYAFDVLCSIPESSILITDGDEQFLFWYLQQVANVRRDVVVLESDALTKTNSWWWDSMKREYPDLSVPDTFVAGDRIQPNMFVEKLMVANPYRKIYFSFLPVFKPVTYDLEIMPDGVIFAYGKKSDLHTMPCLNSALFNMFYAAKLDFTTDNLDPYEKEILSKYVAAYYNYGVFYQNTERHNLALEMFTRSFLLDPAFAPETGQFPTAGILARLHLNEKNYIGACDVLEKLINSGNTDSVWYHMYAVSLIHLERYDDARHVILDALERDENNQFLQHMIQFLSRPSNEIKQSLEDLEEMPSENIPSENIPQDDS
ncbi:DUF2723 domain-containing protein [bacterium]|nr:DUF2723 domain-containing protein [bacterium]